MAKVGVLALQGAFREHREVLEALDVPVCEVRVPEHLSGVDALVIPGGESTTMTRLLDTSGLRGAAGGAPARRHARVRHLRRDSSSSRPRSATGGPTRCRSARSPSSVRRNGYGRQRDSFETGLTVAGLTGAPFPGVFIRAPVVEEVGAGGGARRARRPSGARARGERLGRRSIRSCRGTCGSTSSSSSRSARSPRRGSLS